MSCTLRVVRGGAAKLNTGFYIPLIGLGTYKITGERVKPAVDAALASGYRLFDTAKFYQNEPEIGEALTELLPIHRLCRSDIFLTTKILPLPDDPTTGVGHLVMKSLEDLQTDFLDMVLIHYPKAQSLGETDKRNPLLRKLTYIQLEKLKDKGKIRSVGVSNYEPRHIEEIKKYGKGKTLNTLKDHQRLTRNSTKLTKLTAFIRVLVDKINNDEEMSGAWPVMDNVRIHKADNLRKSLDFLVERSLPSPIRPTSIRSSLFPPKMPCVNQVEFHPHFTRDQLREYCSKEGIFFQAFSSFARQQPDLLEEPAVVDLARNHNTTAQVILLSWALSQGVGVIPKSSTPQRIKDNMQASNLRLNEYEIQALHKLNRNQHYTQSYGWRVL